MAIIVLVATPAAALALDSNVSQKVQHFIECWTLMVTDEAAHMELCSPSNQASLASLPSSSAHGRGKPDFPVPVSREVPAPSSSQEPPSSSSEEPPSSSSEEPPSSSSEEPPSSSSEQPGCDPELNPEECPPSS